MTLNKYCFNQHCNFVSQQIRYWKTGEKNTTMTVVEVFRPPEKDTRLKKRAVKDSATVHGLPPYSDLEADVVAANTYFVSNSSNTVSFSTPEGGKITPVIKAMRSESLKLLRIHLNQ